MGLKILVVDDSANIRAFIKKTLGMTELDIEELHNAANGEEALSVLSRVKIDVILSDINMPVMNGLEFVRKARDKYGKDDIYIVMVSTEGSREKVIECIKAGANGYVKKPFGPEDIMEIINKRGA